MSTVSKTEYDKLHIDYCNRGIEVRQLQAENKQLTEDILAMNDKCVKIRRGLEAENAELKEANKHYVEVCNENGHLKKLAEYSGHKTNCKPQPWENECACGYLQALKKS